MDQNGYCTIKRYGQQKIYVRMKTKTRKQTREVKVQRSEGTAAYFSGTES